MNYKINDSHTDPFYIGFFSVVDFPVSQQFQFDPCSIRKRKPVVIDGFYRIKFDLFHGFFHRINGDGNVVISVLCLCVDVGNFAGYLPGTSICAPVFPQFPATYACQKHPQKISVHLHRKKYGSLHDRSLP